MPDMAHGLKKITVLNDVIRRCQDGDLDARAEIFNETIDHVQRILFRLVGTVPDQEDLIQEVYLALWKAIPSFRSESSFSSFVFGLCIKVAKKHARSWARWSRLVDRANQEATQLEQRADSTDDQVVRKQRSAAVHMALSQISFKHRTVLVLYELEGYSGRQIADQLGISEKTVWTRLHYARKAFRRFYHWPPVKKNPRVVRG